LDQAHVVECGNGHVDADGKWAADLGHADGKWAADTLEMLAANMTSAQIEKAQALAAEWKPTTGQ